MRESWEEAIKLAKERFGELNILINNAGTSYRESLPEISDETWNKTIATNQTGVFYGMQLGIEAIAENGKPGAVSQHPASVDGIVGDSEFFAYCATKAAVQAMTRCAALYCGEKRLRHTCKRSSSGIHTHSYGRRGCSSERSDHRGILQRIRRSSPDRQNGNAAGNR